MFSTGAGENTLIVSEHLCSDDDDVACSVAAYAAYVFCTFLVSVTSKMDRILKANTMEVGELFTRCSSWLLCTLKKKWLGKSYHSAPESSKEKFEFLHLYYNIKTELLQSYHMKKTELLKDVVKGFNGKAMLWMANPVFEKKLMKVDSWVIHFSDAYHPVSYMIWIHHLFTGCKDKVKKYMIQNSCLENQSPKTQAGGVEQAEPTAQSQIFPNPDVDCCTTGMETLMPFQILAHLLLMSITRKQDSTTSWIMITKIMSHWHNLLTQAWSLLLFMVFRKVTHWRKTIRSWCLQSTYLLSPKIY